MDLWDDAFREPTEDDLSARRALSLALALMNAHRALSTIELRHDFYPDMGDEAFKKAFRRDRTRLATAGIHVFGNKLPSGETAWQVDEEASFAHENKLTPEDALVLDSLLLPLASDPSIPFSRDLRHALQKIDRSFDGGSTATLPMSAHKRNNNLTRIESALMNLHAIRMDYVRADGSKTTRSVAPYGLFPLRDTTYMVAARLEDNNEVSTEEPHTYNLRRITRVRELTRVGYAIPVDFDIRDFLILPFQVGPELYRGTFFVPEHRQRDVRAHMTMSEKWVTLDEGAIFEASVSDEDVAAAWSLAENVRPMSPDSLVEKWRSRIRSYVMQHADLESHDEPTAKQAAAHDESTGLGGK